MNEAFEVIVGTRYRVEEEVAVAWAVKRLALEDTTDIFVGSDVFDVNLYGGGGGQNIGVGLCFNAEFSSDSELREFMNALVGFDSVETVERIHYEELA